MWQSLLKQTGELTLNNTVRLEGTAAFEVVIRRLGNQTDTLCLAFQDSADRLPTVHTETGVV